MRQLEREKRAIWIAQYAGREQVVGEDGLMTGEWVVRYSPPEEFIGTLSPRSGNVYADGFGLGVNQDRTFITSEIGTGITESCVAWVDSRPVVNDDGELVVGDDGVPVTPNDYSITMVAESYNFTNIALKKVE